ncbi:LacI family DNA-binding transcriptional regulator [Chitinophaga tropicalis]|uniref:Substrate-binding domain-containing protein n=1 Tax=Chitinophaga tropicalis TaxID=2683588 RepID=A0A7K1U0N3_9BACT|nr:LacI family DNA-binding transcriptional regulator [Chitinophaga tropicalis]MVT07927.1 substrate-binding domain-containing protein [Chitinophaga tropicalis]
MKAKYITIIDIARQLNISKSTVSRALTGHPNVNEQTRKAVLELAASQEYQRNSLALGFSRHKTHTVGILVPEFMSTYFPSVIVGAQTVLQEAGYNVVICQQNESYETEVANIKLLLSYRVDGIIVSHTKETRNFDHFTLAQRIGIPLVFFNRIPEDMNVPGVVVNDYEAAFQAVEHLIKIGRKCIAHLAGPESLVNSRLRRQGYIDALKKYNIPYNPDLVLSYDLTMEKVKIYMKHFLDLATPPDALFAINDPTAIAAMEVVKAAGLRIPEDIAIVGFSNDFSAELVYPGLTTMAQPTSDIGRTAANMLLQEMHAKVMNDYSIKKAPTVTLPTKLIIRDSTVKKEQPSLVKKRKGRI